MVRTQYAKHSPSLSSQRPSASSLAAAGNAIIILTTLVLCLSGGVRKGRDGRGGHYPPAAGRARRALSHLVLLSQRFVWPFSLSIFSFYLLLIFLLLLLLLLLFLACILLISRRPQSKGLRRGGGAWKVCGKNLWGKRRNENINCLCGMVCARSGQHTELNLR